MRLPPTLEELVAALEEQAEKRGNEDDRSRPRDPHICVFSRHALLVFPAWLRYLLLHVGMGLYDYLLECNGISIEKAPQEALLDQINSVANELGVASDVLAEIAAEPQHNCVEDPETLAICQLAAEAVPAVEELVTHLRRAHLMVPPVEPPSETPSTAPEPQAN